MTNYSANKFLLFILLLTNSENTVAEIQLDKVALNLNENNRIEYIEVYNDSSTKSELLIVNSEADKTVVTILPPKMILEPLQRKSVKIIYKPRVELEEETLELISFKSVPEETGELKTLSMYLAQRLPLIITPKTLDVNIKYWELLEFKLNTTDKKMQLNVSNPSPYIVRFDNNIEIDGISGHVNLGKSYLLPYSSLTVDIDNNMLPNLGQKLIKFRPVNRFGSIMKWIFLTYE